MQEQWKPVADWPEYEVSNLGKVRRDGHVHSGYVSSSTGYRITQLSKGPGTKRTRSIHRLVALAFIPNPENKRCINHIDRDRSNNIVTNLEWVTHSENQQHMARGRNKPAQIKRWQALDSWAGSDKEGAEEFGFAYPAFFRRAQLRARRSLQIHAGVVPTIPRQA